MPVNANVSFQVDHRIAVGAIVEDEGRVLLVRHFRPGRYDFWVAPGGAVQGSEELAAAVVREVREECGLAVEPGRVAYIEELFNPDMRQVKFWFTARLLGGVLSTLAAEAQSEHIVEAAWLSREELRGRTVFPPVLAASYWQDRDSGFSAPVHLGLRRMGFW